VPDKKSRLLVLIPARFASTRFPGKPLAVINGKSMIQRVYENCKKSGCEVAVVTDDSRIEDHVKSFNGRALRVDDDLPSGTERIELAFRRFYNPKDFDLVINVQGDEPLLKGEEILRLAEYHLKSTFDIATLVREEQGGEYKDPNRVKAIFCEGSGQCLYFSRAAVPFYRETKSEVLWHLHIGVYSYKPQALLSFCKLPVSRLENCEKLEQLRALEAGIKIGAIKTTFKLMGVDTHEDLLKVEGVFRGLEN